MENHTMGGPKPNLPYFGQPTKQTPHYQQQHQNSLIQGVTHTHNKGMFGQVPSEPTHVKDSEIKWGYGIKGNTRAIFKPAECEVIESHFQKMKSNPELPHRMEILTENGEKLILDFFQMRVSKERDPNFLLSLSRILPEHAFIPYKIPKNPKEDPLDNPFGVKEDKLIPQWIRWDGSDASFQSYHESLWSAYSVHESTTIEEAHKKYLVDLQQHRVGDEVNAVYPIDAFYCVNFKNWSQFRSNNPAKRRRIRRVLYRWFWEDNNKNWMAYTKEQCVEIEQALLSNSPETSITISGEPYTINFFEMCQYHTSSQLKRRALLRVGPKIERKVVFIGDPNLKGDQLLVQTGTSFPQYWSLPCNEYLYEKVSLDTKLGKQIRRYFSTGNDLEMLSIHCVQSPQKWGSYMHKRGKLIQRSVVDQISPQDKQYLSQKSLQAPLLDSHTNEYYLWHGNTHQLITGLTSKQHEIGLALRSAVLSGSGGFYFADRPTTANMYSTCKVCNGGGTGINGKTCHCLPNAQLFTLVLCRVMLGKIQCLHNYNHDEFNSLTKTIEPISGYKADSILGVGANDFREIIINDESQIYPEFVIHYRRTKVQKHDHAETGLPDTFNNEGWNNFANTNASKKGNAEESISLLSLNLSDTSGLGDHDQSEIPLSDRPNDSNWVEEPVPELKDSKKKKGLGNWFGKT